MIEWVKKTSTYIAGILTFFFGIKASFGFSVTWGIELLTVTSVIVAASVIAWLEVGRNAKRRSEILRESEEVGSISVAVKLALSRVRFADHDDEAIAFEANRVVRQGLDKHCIKYEDYKTWRKINPVIFTAITDDQDQLIGFFDIFPLTKKAGIGLMTGRLHEHDLTEESILPVELNPTAEFVYIASIMVNPHQRSFVSLIAKEVLVLKFAEKLIAMFPPNDAMTIFAYAHTVAGERLLVNSGFKNSMLSQFNKQGDPLYKLSGSGYAKLINNYQEFISKEGTLKRMRPRSAPQQKR